MSITERQVSPVPLLSVGEVAVLLGVHEVSVRRFVERGELPAVRLGHGVRARVRIDPRDLSALTVPVIADVAS
jgi:excisionase family DNA binding protein